jgi:ABC-type polysaccharide transport system permease subunit
MIGAQIAFKKFSPRRGIMGSPFIGWQNFIRFFESPSSMQIIVNTIVISLYSIAASFPFALALAVALNEVRSKKFKKSVQMVTYAPYFISTVVLVSMINQFFNPTIGIINLFFKLFGIELGNVVGSPSVFRHLYVWSGVWQSNGYNAIIYLAALTGISPELQEAAVVDGCTRIKRIWHVDLPCIRPTIVTLLILSVGQVMSVGFEKIFLMQNPAVLSISEVVSTYVYRIGLTGSTDPGYASAIGLFNSVVNVVLILLANFAARRIDGTGLW